MIFLILYLDSFDSFNVEFWLFFLFYALVIFLILCL